MVFCKTVFSVINITLYCPPNITQSILREIKRLNLFEIV